MSRSIKIGDSSKYEFSQPAIQNINILLKYLKIRLGSNSKFKSKDKDNNIIYIDNDIFATENLVGFLVLSLSEFNQTPQFTNFSFEDSDFVGYFSDALISGAYLYALSSQALIEKGREYQIVDGGIMFDPPQVSEMLLTQYLSLLNSHCEKIKDIKKDILNWKKQ